MQKGLRPRRSVRTAMAHEIMMCKRRTLISTPLLVVLVQCSQILFVHADGIVQKDGLGFDRAVEECKARMARYSVSPNMLIVRVLGGSHEPVFPLSVLAAHMGCLRVQIPPQLALYMSVAPEEKIVFNKGGPSAVANFEAGVAGFEARAFRGLGVFTSTPVRRFACRAARLRLSLSVALQD